MKPIDLTRFRPEAECLEAREVPTVGIFSIGLLKTADASCYSPGTTATYTYTVSTPADSLGALFQVTLVDDNGTPGVTTDDFTLQPGVDTPAIDDNGTPGITADDHPVPTVDPILEPGHSWTFQKQVLLANVTANTTITNTAVVTANGANGDTPVPVSATAKATVMICVPTPPTPLAHGDTATIGFWHNKNGQALIDGVNGGSTSTALATWLSNNFPSLYGVGGGTSNLTGKTNSDVAALFMKDFNQ